MHLNDLREMEIKKLNRLAEDLKIENASAMKRHEVIFAILKAKASKKRANLRWWSFRDFARWLRIFKIFWI